ncbi:hypothetical protein FRC05_010903 [Tulasnella sp. 425]|nr:hypothetical protein FRC05_010903 [Tulasnella sp. 425]
MTLSIVSTLLALAAVVGLANADHNVTVQAWDLTDIHAIYVIGTVDCDWSGLINITLDNNTPINFDRRACVGDVCDYPWFTATNLPNTQHTLNLTLTGPPISKAPSKHIIADFRYLLYTVPDASSSVPSAVTSSVSPSGTSTNLPDSGSQNKGVSGGVIGGVVAGIVIVILIGIIAFLLCARKRARDRQPHPIDLGGEQHPLAPTGLTAPQDMSWSPWIPDPSQDFGPTGGSQTSKSLMSLNTSTTNLVIPSAQVAAPTSSSGRESSHPSDGTDSSGQNRSLGGALPPSTDPDLVQRISETVAAMLREGNAPPPAYEPPPPVQPPRPRKR